MEAAIMKKIIIFITVLICGILLNSCSKDLLDIKQQGALNPDVYYPGATDEQALQLIASIYSSAYRNLNWNGTFNGLGDDGNTFDNLNVNSQNHPGNGTFTSLYRINYLCNMIIERLPNNSDVKAQVIGEAYFWRAYVNIYLIRLWGTPPLVDHVLAPSELQPANGDPAALWNYVETSLETAISLLPEKAALGGQRAIGGRVTKHAVYALLGKAQVIKGDYAEAITTLNQVISSGKYNLLSNYRDLYHLPGDFCDEYLWEWNMNDADQANYLNEGDNRAVTLTWRTENVTVPGGLTVQGYGGADFRKGLYDFYVARGEQGKPRQLGTIWSYEDILNRFISLGLAANTTEAIDAFWGGEPVMQNCEGYFRCKGLVFEGEWFNYDAVQQIRSKINWPGMRYAEVLLLYAEACVQSGTHLTEGLAALNLVRQRAGLTNMGSYTLNNLKDEKRAEMAFECERYFDLVRWGDAPTVLANRGLNSYQFRGYLTGTTNYNITTIPVVGASGFRAGRDELFPFPYNERLLNPNLVQNPNW
jgi:hypothetical protein